MAAEALITGLLALLAFAVVVGVLVEVILNVAEKGFRALLVNGQAESESNGETQRFKRVGKHHKACPETDDKYAISRHGRKGPLVLSALILGCVLFPHGAYAIETQILVDGNTVFYPNSNDTGLGYVVVADNQYVAACAVLGIDYAGLTDDQKALLSNESTGGAFYGFVQGFYNADSGGRPSFITDYYFLPTAAEVFGRDYVFWTETTIPNMAAARVVYESVVNGGGSGGGSDTPAQSGIPDSFTVYAAGGVQEISWRNAPKPQKDIEVVLTQPQTVNERYEATQSMYWVGMATYFVQRVSSSGSSVSPGFRIYSSASPITLTINEQSTVTFNNRTYTTYEFDVSSDSDIYVSGGGVSFGGTTTTVSVPNGSSYFQTWTNLNTTNVHVTSSQGSWLLGVWRTEEGQSELPIPETNWPVPVDPHIWQAPPLPDPTMPITPDPVDEPIYTPDPTMPIPSPEDGPTYTTADLSAVLDAMNRHCIHLQNAIYGAASQFWGLLSSKLTANLGAFTTWLGSWFGTFITTFQAGLSGLESYLHELAAWLAEQLDYTFTSSSYDDGSVVAWLKKIWAKLGTGPIVTRPDDPVSDPSGWGDWLKRLLDNFIAALMGLGAELLGGIGDDLAALSGKFPFCIPWDLGAVLALFAADPVTPVVEYPLYTVTMDGLTSTPCVIDCSPYDPYMVVVRGVELAIFCAGLAWKTKDVLEGFALAGGD